MTARSFQSRWIALPLVVLAAVAGTPERATFSALAAPAFVQNSSGTLTVGGRTRTYEVHLPSAYVGKTALPIVFVLHGGGGTGRGMIALTHFDALADRHSFIVVYPDGVQRAWADARGGTVAERVGVDDVGFIAMLIEKLATEFTIDTRRVYATGISNGGFMTQRLACELSAKVTAVAVVAATMAEALAAQCRPTRPVPLLLIHGTEDPLVPWDGGQVTIGAGGRILSAPATIQKWLTLNGCAPGPVVTEEAIDTATGTRVRREAYSRCKEGAEVILLAIEGGGHTWPGGPQYLPERFIGKTNHTLDASAVIWEFFEWHHKN